MVYGSHSTDMNDQLSLSAMVDYWMSPTAVKKDFELARRKLYFNYVVLGQLTSTIQLSVTPPPPPKKNKNKKQTTTTPTTTKQTNPKTTQQPQTTSQLP